jgi:hypothetical protein
LIKLKNAENFIQIFSGWNKTFDFWTLAVTQNLSSRISYVPICEYWYINICWNEWIKPYHSPLNYTQSNLHKEVTIGTKKNWPYKRCDLLKEVKIKYQFNVYKGTLTCSFLSCKYMKNNLQWNKTFDFWTLAVTQNLSSRISYHINIILLNRREHMWFFLI